MLKQSIFLPSFMEHYWSIKGKINRFLFLFHASVRTFPGERKGQYSVVWEKKFWFQTFKQAQNKQLDWSHKESKIPRTLPSYSVQVTLNIALFFLLVCLYI